MATEGISRGKRGASAYILAKGVAAGVVRAATFSRIAGEAPRRPRVSSVYQSPMPRQLTNVLPWVPPAGTNDTIICPATPRCGGISASLLIAGAPLTTHCD